MPFKRAARQVFAGFTIIELAGEVIVLQHRTLFTVAATFQRQAWFLEIVVAPGDDAGAGFHAHVETLNRRRARRHAAARQIQRWRGQLGEYGLVVAEHQQMAFGAVLKVVMNADFGTQTLDKGQVAFGVLHAVLALWIFAAQAKLKGIAQDRMVLENLSDNFRHALMLKNPLVDAMPQIRQTRGEAQVIACQTFPGVALSDLINLTVNTATLSIKTQICLTMQQAFQIQVRPLADQFQFEAKGLADGFPARELKDLEVMLGAFEGQRETRLIGRREHPMSLCSVRAGDSA